MPSIIQRIAILTFLFSLLALPCTAQPGGAGSLDALLDARSTRIIQYSSHASGNSNNDYVILPPGQQVVVLDHSGPGIVRRWWMTLRELDQPEVMRNTIVRCYWDNEPTPSVEVPLSDFFGAGFGLLPDYSSLPLSMARGGMNCYWPMPFKSRARITIENRFAVPLPWLYFNIAVEAGPALPDTLLYFHAQFRRVDGATAGEPITILEAEGRGHYVGTVLSVQPREGKGAMTYLEGDEAIQVDGESTPAIQGSGTEDYFGSAWYYNGRAHSMPYHGAPIVDTSTNRTSAYRWHIEDPIPFRSSLRFTLEHGGANDAVDYDYSSVAYWYQTHPRAAFPRLPDSLSPTSAVPGGGGSENLEGISLTQNIPNPFSGRSAITFTLAERSAVTLTIHTAEGRVLRTLVDETISAGTHTIPFDASILPSGAYFYTLRTPSGATTLPMVVVK